MSDESDTTASGTYRIDCPACDWQSREFGEISGELAAKVDAADHYVGVHGGKIPDEASFGKHQCPKCFDIHGLDGTASCSECGWIPEENRLVPDGGTPADGVEPSDTFVQDISSIEGVNEATRRVNCTLDELRKRGVSDIRVLIVDDTQTTGVERSEGADRT